MKRTLSVSLSILSLLAASAAGCAANEPLDAAESAGESAEALTASAVLRRSFALDGTTAHRNEICDLDVDWLNGQLGLSLSAGDQLRIVRSNGTAGQKGACTIQDHDGAGNVVRMGNEGFKRIEVTAPGNETTETAIVLDSDVSSAAYGIGDEVAAKNAQELFDDVQEADGTQTDVVVLAPHGGQMELRTDTQANTHFYDQLLAGSVTSWQASGYNSSGDGINASAHWHITATDLGPTGFHHLAGVTARRFRYPVAFHGYSSTRNGLPFHRDEVLVGGRESALFRREIAEMITLGARNPSTLATTITGVWQSLPSDLDGNDDDNIVNWLGTAGKGLQLEQSSEARGVQSGTPDHSDEIARAVGAVYRCLIDPPRWSWSAQNVGTSTSFHATPQGDVCDRLLVDVSVPSSETSSFALSGQIRYSELSDLTQAQCSKFEGYVSIYKEVGGRWERQLGGALDAAWSGGACLATVNPGALTVSPPSSGTAKYRISVKGAYGSTLPMTRMLASATVRRL